MPYYVRPLEGESAVIVLPDAPAAHHLALELSKLHPGETFELSCDGPRNPAYSPREGDDYPGPCTLTHLVAYRDGRKVQLDGVLERLRTFAGR